MLKEFKEFLKRGNVLAFAVGVIIAGAFGLIVKSLVEDIIMPIVGKVLGGVSFAELFISLDGVSYPNLAAAEKAGAAVMRYGVFINTIVNFIIIAFVVFLIVKMASKLEKKPEEVTTKACKSCTLDIPLAATKCPHCTSEQ